MRPNALTKNLMAIKRYTPLARSTKRIPRISARRRRERAVYSMQNEAYLKAHPFCQITIAIRRLVEAEVIAQGGRYSVAGERDRIYYVPRATQIHHRNKCRGARLTDDRWFMSASSEGHDQVENLKDWARQIDVQLLLPMEADADGRTPGGIQYLTTPELLEARAQGGPQ